MRRVETLSLEKSAHRTDYKTVDTTKHAGDSLKQALDAVARITTLNRDAATMAEGQTEVAVFSSQLRPGVKGARDA